MTVRAIILLLCISVYHLDVMTAVDVCNRMGEKTASCKQTESKCGSQSNTQCPKEADEDCAKICVNCPFFFNAVIAQGISLTLHSIELSRNFPRYEVNVIHEFFTKAWKPPNSFSI
jgi:hypothetical protein